MLEADPDIERYAWFSYFQAAPFTQDSPIIAKPLSTFALFQCSWFPTGLSDTISKLCISFSLDLYLGGVGFPQWLECEVVR